MIDVVAVVEDVGYDRSKVNLAAYANEVFVALAEALDRHGPPLRVRELAACRGMPVAVFFPGRGQRLAEARSVCERCPVAAECGTWAAGRGSSLGGVWAGVSGRDRRTA